MNFPALIFWLVIVCSFWARPGTVLVLLLASIPFASLSLLPPEIIGGMTLLPQMMFAVVLILKVVAPHVVTLSPKFVNALQLRSLGYLALFLLTGIVVTLIMPRLFQGQVVVFPMKYSYMADLLGPSQANFTQSGYVVLSVMTAFAVMLMADEPGFTGTLLKAVLAGGMVCIVTGLIDVAAASTGMESLLEPFRNAQYAYLTDATVGAGARRVVGFTPEASAYGPICVEFAAVTGLLRTLYAEGPQRMHATIVAVSLVVMALLSTSSTAYGGLAVLGLVYAGNWIRRVAFSSPLGQSGLLGELLVGLGAIIALLFVLVASLGPAEPTTQPDRRAHIQQAAIWFLLRKVQLEYHCLGHSSLHMGSRHRIWINPDIELVRGGHQQCRTDWRCVHGSLPGPNLCQAIDFTYPIVGGTTIRAEVVTGASFGDVGC